MTSTKKITTAAATFGAALTSLYAAPELQADIIDLTFTPGSVPSGVMPVPLVQLGSTGGVVGSFFQFNGVTGKSVLGTGGLEFFIGSFGQDVSGSTFVGDGLAEFGASLASTVFVGFRTDDEPTANVGWFSIDLGGPGNAVTYIEGEFGNAGETVTIGGTAIPEPASAALAALALGAVGLRRRRKK